MKKYLKNKLEYINRNSFYFHLYIQLLNEIKKKNYVFIILLNIFLSLLDVINIGLIISILFKSSFLNIFSNLDQSLSKEGKIVLLLIFLILKGFLRIKLNVFLKKFICKITDQFREKIFKNILNANNEELEKYGKNELTNIYMVGINRSVNAIEQGASLVQSLLFSLIYITSLIFISRESLFLIFLAIFSTSITSVIQNYRAWEIGVLRSKFQLNLLKVFGDSLNGLKAIKAINATDWLLGKLIYENKKSRNFSERVLKTKLYYRFYGEILILLLFCFWLFQNSEVFQTSFIIANVFLLLRLSNSFTKLIESLRNIITSLSGFLEVKKVNSMLKTKFINRKNYLLFQSEISENDIKELSWHFRIDKENYYSLKLEKPCICVLKGKSGIGKTTFLDLFAGLLYPKNSSWEFGLNNNQIYSLIGDEGAFIIRNLFSYSTQESFFFEGSFKDNLLLTNIKNKKEELIKVNQIREFLLKFDLQNILERDFTLERPLNLTLDFYSGGEKSVSH